MTFLHPLFQKGVSLFLENPVGQALGFLAMIIGITGFIITDDRKTIKIFIISCVFWILHFIFMHNYGALGATVIGLIRLILSLKYKKSLSLLIAIIAVSLALWIYSFDGKFISMLPLIATGVSSYGFFFLEKIKLRILLAWVSLLWFSYHLNTGSISGIVNEIFVQITIWYSVYKFATWSERKEKILERLRAKIRTPKPKINFWRYIFLKDRERFE